MGYRPGRRVGSGRNDDRGIGLPVTLALLGVFAVAVGAIWYTGAGAYAYWWMTNTEPPTVALSVPDGPVRSLVPVQAQVGPEGRASPVEAAVDTRPLPAELRMVIDSTTLPDGDHQVTLVAEDHSWRRNRATATVTLRTDNTAPRLAVEVLPMQVQQGHTWLLRIRSNEQAAVDARLGDRTLTIVNGNGYGWAMLGFGPNDDPRAFPLVVDGRDQAGNESRVSQTVQLAAENWTRDEVEIPRQIASLLESDIRANEDKALLPTYQKVSPDKLWEGRFMVPVQGEIITPFGTLRSYNGGPVVGHHGGADIAAGAGRNDQAAARGRVVTIDKVQLRGNIVILDHGLGVFTTYAHLASVDVQAGQLVERGQAIAKVGSTGLSTGPHLHWELWVGGQNVNPLEWTERDIP